MATFRHQYRRLPRHALVLCAVLVENPMNLGGLCRLAEALRLEALVLRDLKLTENRKFRQLAVTTQHWQPLQECPLEQLPGWIQGQQQRGYRVLALARRPDSQSLWAAPLPQRAVLLLGRELTGIPSEILTQCDQTLAIPQYGLVDSLNVQTAAAMALSEYIRQWGMDQPPENLE
ncbi:MAG TPA: RNA methyltransferase [Leptolyngbyaceae cyanobacterium M65_K2018_010]|nr:RNA methyltransferase [Leptolyngbyaceae cyanobacterium M65_K2018_010]